MYSKIFQEIGIRQFIQLLSTSKVALHTTSGILFRQIRMLIKDCLAPTQWPLINVFFC